jgi:preprotein translocase subunit SecA
MSFFSKLTGGQHTSGVKKFEPVVPTINSLEEQIKAVSDIQIKEKTIEFRKRLEEPRTKSQEPNKIQNPNDKFQIKSKVKSSNSKSWTKEDKAEEDKALHEILPEAFALVREAARRTLGQRHFDVQLIGGMVLNSGAIAEMRTGEGKTLVATLPAYLNALSGKGVHIVTVNDYLSRRDAVWMGQIYDALGLSVAVINHEASFMYDPKHREVEATSPSAPASASAEAAPASRPLRAPKAASGEIASTSSDPLDRERDQLGAFKVVHEFLRPCSRREAYAADITYGTNVEFGFDYLRDNLEYSPDRLRQRDFNYAIVDEIDSILIDEARTPLIISAPTRDAEATYKQFASLVSGFTEDTTEDGKNPEGKAGDYTIDEKRRAISLTENGITKAEKALGIENIYTDAGIKSVHHLETAVKAKALYHLNKEYVVKGDEVVIVDEFTGRLQPGRRWSEGLHQAIEAKEGVKIQQESRTYATVTYQNFFRMYPKLSGMTGTAATSAEEFFKVYGLDVYTVPTNVPAIRKDSNDQIFRTEAGKFKAIARKVKELHTAGRPVLIGTVSIEKNELLSQFLRSEGIPHTILNAKPEYAEREGETVAQAGRKGAVTIATNMAGRGVDVKLGGAPNTPETYEEVKKAGGLFVLGTERHEARRIDNQLRGRSGRQGDPGETQFFVSLEDNLMRVFASDMLKSMMGKLGMAEDEPIEHRMISKSLEAAQEKIEGFNFDARKHVLEFDDVINHQRATIYCRRRKLLLGSLDDVEDELYQMIGIGSQKPEAGSLKPGGTQARSNDFLGSKLQAPSSKLLASAEQSKQTDVVQEIINRKINEFGREAFLSAVRIVLLQTIDMYWVEHLEVMDYTRSSVNLRAYGQRDPLVEYKKEGLRLYREMLAAMQGQFIRILPNIVPIANGQPISKSETRNPKSDPLRQRDSVARTNSKSQIQNTLKEVQADAQFITSGDGSGKIQPTNKEPGRNDLCPCGSNKKYKNCGLKNTPEHQRLIAGK